MSLDPTTEFLTTFFQSHYPAYESKMKDAGSVPRPPLYEEQGEVIDMIRDIVHSIGEDYLNLSVPQDYPSPSALRIALIGLRDRAAKYSTRIQEIAKKQDWLNDMDYASEICHEVSEAIDHALTLTKDQHTTDSTPPLRLGHLLIRLPQVARQLEIRRKDGQNMRPTIRIKDEFDVQDLLHAILKLEFDDIRSEEWTPSYAGLSKRSDFLLKNEQILVEVKKTSAGHGQKHIVEELVIDIAHYQTHPDCKHLFCAVWDTDHILANPAGMKSDLEKSHQGFVTVVVLV